MKQSSLDAVEVPFFVLQCLIVLPTTLYADHKNNIEPLYLEGDELAKLADSRNTADIARDEKGPGEITYFY